MATPATRPAGSSPTPTVRTPPRVLSLRVVRYSALNPDPPFAAQTTNTVAVQRLFAATLAAPLYSHQGDWGCYDAGVSYLLTFSSATGVVLRAWLEGGAGCPGLGLFDWPNGCRDDTDAYEQLVADTLHVPVADLSINPVLSMPPGAPTAPATPSAAELPPTATLLGCHR